MSKFGELIRRSFKAYIRHWLMNVVIVFLLGIIVSGYTMSTDNRMTDMTTRVSGSSNAVIINDLVNYLSIGPGEPETRAGQYTKGVLSVFVNQVSDSGSVVFGILNGFNTLIFAGRVSNSITIFLGIVLLLMLLIFGRNVIQVGVCRYFMEHRLYSETRIDRAFFVYRYGRTMNVATTMMLRSLFQSLWNLTIIGGFIKTYEYMMIPYILAEDPDIDWHEAFRLSKEMSRGYKKKMFLYDILFSVGYIISSFSLNSISIFLLDPLRACLYAEIYADLRVRAVEQKLPYSAHICDTGLDIEGFHEGAYPEKIFAIKPVKRRQWMKVDFRKNYTFTTFILFFFSYSFVGWAWEVFYTLLTQGVLANRGVLNGPWLPIYGCGGLLIMLTLRPLREHPVLVFLGAFTICGILEYFTSWLLEFLFDAKWWDYTGFFLNINGRICLEGLLVFGFAGLAFTYLFSPMLDSFYQRLRGRRRRWVCILLCSIFAMDLIMSIADPNTGEGITETDPAETSITMEVSDVDR